MLTKKENLKNEVKNNKNGKNTFSPADQTASCCQPVVKSDQLPTRTYTSQLTRHSDTYTDNKKTSKTRITIKYDVGYPNQLFIRGKGANLSWDKGQPLKNIKADEWVWETDAHFTSCEFKILINDRVYENGDNHHLNAGSTLVYTPHFY